MRRLVVPEKVNAGERRLLMENIIDGTDQHQTAIMKFYEIGVLWFSVACIVFP